MTVYANGLEVSCTAQANKVIAAFPYVCFTPPQTPATPPGVPVPYPTFGLDSDTDKGTGTVKIGGKTVNQKNKSYYKKCTGNEAGCAPKKNIITSVNTGKEYAHAWSGNVKMDGEPVCRFTDIATNDHSSTIAGGPPMVRVGILDVSDPRCAFLGIKPYKELTCAEGYEKEHTVEVQFFTAGGVRDLTLRCCESYDDREAPCICMKATWITGEAAEVKKKTFPRRSGGTFRYRGAVVGKKRGTAHYYKSAEAASWIKDNTKRDNPGKLGDFMDTCIKSTVNNLGLPEDQKAIATECLEVANMNYLKTSMNKTEDEVKALEICHASCTRAVAEGNRVAKAKKKLRKTTVSAAEVESGSGVPRPPVGCRKVAP
jgi:hypothetical protein